MANSKTEIGPLRRGQIIHKAAQLGQLFALAHQVVNGYEDQMKRFSFMTIRRILSKRRGN
jgi:hypothetical protein